MVRFDLRISLGLRPRDFPRAQAIFHRIPLLSSQYSYKPKKNKFTQNSFIFRPFFQVELLVAKWIFIVKKHKKTLRKLMQNCFLNVLSRLLNKILSFKIDCTTHKNSGLYLNIPLLLISDLSGLNFQDISILIHLYQIRWYQ